MNAFLIRALDAAAAIITISDEAEPAVDLFQITCGHAITSQHHTMILVGYIAQRYHPGTLPLLLAEAATRLAIARGAK
jgi:hypothetical protein